MPSVLRLDILGANISKDNRKCECKMCTAVCVVIPAPNGKEYKDEHSLKYVFGEITLSIHPIIISRLALRGLNGTHTEDIHLRIVIHTTYIAT